MSRRSPSRLNMVIMSSPPLISLIKADPMEVVRKTTCTGLPVEALPSHEPESDLSCSKLFCASDAAKARVPARAEVRTATIATAVRSAFISVPPKKSFVLGAMLTAFLRVFGFHKRFQISETALPEDPVILQPGIHGLQGFRVELVQTMPAFAPLLDQMG